MMALMLFTIVFYSTMVYNAPSLEICINNNMKTDIHPNYINDDSISLVLYGDVPLIRQSTLKDLITQAQK
jgi:hypothetical protein